MHTYNYYSYHGLSENRLNGEANIVMPNGIKMTHNAFWTLYGINKEVMGVILA